jgi:small subunit ribosomal protein S16
MLTIRLARIGKKNRAQFQIVLQEHTVAPGGRHVEVLGSHDPHQKKTVFKEERVKYWLEKGAQASDTIHNLLLNKGIISGEKRKVKMPKKAEAPAEEIKVEEAKEAVKTEEAIAAPMETAPETKTEEKPAEETKSAE